MKSTDATEGVERRSTCRAVPAWTIILCLMISLAGIADHELWTPDEPREAAIALAMSRNGNFVVPELAGEPFVEKPPLYYILSSRLLALLGHLIGNTPALRLTSALFGLATLGMTWLLARRLTHPEPAALSPLILATMPGFIQVTHWLLVDNALVFFLTASFWALAEAYVGRRPGFLMFAGLFAAGAFLSKGIIGPLLIGLGWLGFVLPGLLGPDRRSLLNKKWLAMFMIGLVAFAVPVLVWAWSFRTVGGIDAWNEWLWTNHFGRFSGQAQHLGHNQGPFYYLERAPLLMLPWSVLLVIGFMERIFRPRPAKSPQEPWPFLAAWGIGGFLLFSLSATKRDIYLVVLMPAFSIMTALMLAPPAGRPEETAAEKPDGVAPRLPAWASHVLAAWAVVMLVLMAVATAVPILAPLIPAIAPDLPASFAGVFTGWKVANTAAAISLVLSVIMITRPSLPFFHRCIGITAVAYVMLLAILCPMIDKVKNYGPAFDNLAGGAQRLEGKAAIWNPDETTRAGFYYYCDLVFPVVSDIVELRSILEGAHPLFSEAIVSSKNFPPETESLPEWVVLQSETMGPKRVLQRIGPRLE